MERRTPRDRRPCVEPCERRELLSAITDVMASTTHASHGALSARPSSVLAAAASPTGANPSFTLSRTSIAIPTNQGPLLNPDGTINNLALAPTGILKPGEIRRQRFVARFVGPYSVVPGRTSTEAIQTLIQGAGTANTMLHCDFQVRLVTPKDPTQPIGGVSSIFDRNLNTNTVLGFDLAAPQQNVDRGGRPNHITTVSIDVNESAGTYDEAYAQGVIDIHYIPSGQRQAGVISQGTAIVTIHAQIYAANASFILRNASINP
jgi:hypothetical protein